ncbi:MAG: pilus assembly protein PilM [Clostridium sp.]
MKFNNRKQIILKIEDDFIDIIYGNKLKIDFEGTMILKEGLCEDGYLKNVLELSNILNLYFLKHKIKAKEISFVIPSGDTVVRNIKIPYIRGKEFEKSIYLEAEELIANWDEYYIDYEIIKDVKDDSGKIQNQEVLIIGCQKEKIDLLVELSNALGKKLNKIDTLTNTLNKVMINGNIDYTGKSSCLVYLGHNFSNISISENLVFKMDRTILFGVKNIIREYENSNTSVKDENNYKKEKDRFERDILNVDKFFRDNLKVKEILDNFLELIEKTMKFYNSNSEHKKIVEIVLLSQIHISESLLKYLENYLNLNIRYIRGQRELGIEFKSENISEFKYLSLYGVFLRR